MVSIFIRTIIIYSLLTFLLKITGKRQIGELEAGELVSTLLISEVASAPIADGDIPLLNAVLPIIFICCLEVALSAIKNKSDKLKKAFEGESDYVIFRGKLRQSVLEENRISINEVLTEMRTQGVGDLSDIYYAVLEQNGKLSLIKRDDGQIAHSVVIDTKPDVKIMKGLGLDAAWLDKRLKEHGAKLDEVFLMTVNDSGAINIILKEEKK